MFVPTPENMRQKLRKRDPLKVIFAECENCENSIILISLTWTGYLIEVSDMVFLEEAGNSTLDIIECEGSCCSTFMIRVREILFE